MSNDINSGNVLFKDLTNLTPDQVKELDIETALLAVQMNRANALETQLKDKMAVVQDKNQQLAKLSTALGKLNALVKLCPSDMSQATTVEDALAKDPELEGEINDALQALGQAPFQQTDGTLSDGTTYSGGLSASTTKGELDAVIKQLEGMSTSLNSTQQMDMLELQSLSNKRNEAFEIMTNYIKKLQDSNSGIIGNMR